jgi:hypothetical protein
VPLTTNRNHFNHFCSFERSADMKRSVDVRMVAAELRERSGNAPGTLPSDAKKSSPVMILKREREEREEREGNGTVGIHELTRAPGPQVTHAPLL